MMLVNYRANKMTRKKKWTGGWLAAADHYRNNKTK